MANKPIANIQYNKKDVTKDFTPLLTNISFTEFIDGKAGEIELNFYDKNTNFLNNWYPSSEDTIDVQMGFKNKQLIDCGRFWVDEVNLDGSSSGNTCTIRGLSVKTSILNASAQVQYYDAVSIETIVSKIASSLGLSKKGEFSGTFTGWQQGNGLAFLDYIAKKTGRVLKVENETIVFYLIDDLKTESYIVTIKMGNVINYKIKDNADGRWNKCTCKWFDVKTKKTIEGSYSLGVKGGEATIWEEVKDQAEAVKKATDWIKDKTKDGQTITINCDGDTRLRAGIRVELVNFGRFNGNKYYVSKAKHDISKDGGYTVEITLRK